MKNYVMVNCINWQNLDNLPLEAGTEFTYFVLPVAAHGALLGMNGAQEAKFVSDVHAAGKKATYSIAGGAQNSLDIKTALTSYRTAFIDDIYTHMNLHGYDGVTIDIENTDIAPDLMVTFFRELRLKLGSAIIGCYTQPYQLNTVWAKVAEIKDYITWISPMLYDYPNSVLQIKSAIEPWAERVGKEKVLLGTAVNYDATGFDLNEWLQALDIVNAEGWGGVGIWQNNLYTEPYRAVVKEKFGTVVPAPPPPDLNDILLAIEDLRGAVDSRDTLELVEAVVWGGGTLSERMRKIKLLVPNS